MLVRFFNIKKKIPPLYSLHSKSRSFKKSGKPKKIKKETLVCFFNIKKKFTPFNPYILSPGRPRSPANLKKNKETLVCFFNIKKKSPPLFLTFQVWFIQEVR
jgi:hypothetical protein